MKKPEKNDIPAAVFIEHEYQESHSGSYSTTTTLSMNKTELMSGKMLSIPSTIRYVVCVNMIANMYIEKQVFNCIPYFHHLTEI